MAIPETTAQCIIDPNPDIIGVGVRTSLYTLTLAGPLLSHLLHSTEFTRSINASLGLQGLALFLAALISTANNTIALFHALCLFHMLALAGITISPKGRYPLGRARYWAFTTLYVLVIVGSLAFFIYVFAAAERFGEQKECNSRTVYVLFGYDIVATNTVLRYIFVAGLALIMLGFVMYLMVGMGMACCLALDCACCFGGSCRTTRPAEEEVAVDWDDDDEGLRKRGFPYHLIGHLFASSYIIAMLELMIRRNNLGPGTGLWTFGQVLAMVLLLGPLIELGALLIGKMEAGGDAQRAIELRRRADMLEGRPRMEQPRITEVG
jgi:hypothetical protein